MILWLPHSPDSPSRTPKPLTDEGMEALGEVVLATIDDGIERSMTIEGCTAQTSRRALRLDGKLICDVMLVKNGKRICMNVHPGSSDFLIFFEARPEEPPAELIN